MISDYEREKLGKFYAATGAGLSCYRHATFSYLALKETSNLRLCKGVLHLDWRPPQKLPPDFETPLLKAQYIALKDLRLSAKELIDALLSGALQTRFGKLDFPPEKDRSYELYYSNRFGSRQNPNSEEIREVELDIRGDKLQQKIEFRELDSIIKSSTMPFHSIRDFAETYRLGSVSRQEIAVEITAAPLSVLAPKCAVVGTTARMSILLPSGLQRNQSSISYWLEAPNAIKQRGKFNGDLLSWSEDDDIQVGEIVFDVPSGAIVYCVANHEDIPQHQNKFSDPLASHNLIHAIFKTFDQNLEGCKDVLFKAYKKGNGGKSKSPDAREFETAVGWLFGMLGFSVVQLGATTQTSEAPDMISITRKGHVAVIECTTGMLKEDSKLPTLGYRAEKVRKCLAASGFQHLRVLPIIVTQRTEKEVSIEAGLAIKEGIFVIARETLDSMIKRSEVPNDSDELFAKAEASIREIDDPISLASLGYGQSSKPRNVWE
jgi:hypothetical protein